MKRKISKEDYIKANRKASREAEIEAYGHPICHKRVFVSKKAYNRKKQKASDKGLPLFLSHKENIKFSNLQKNTYLCTVYFWIYKNVEIGTFIGN